MHTEGKAPWFGWWRDGGEREKYSVLEGPVPRAVRVPSQPGSDLVPVSVASGTAPAWGSHSASFFQDPADFPPSSAGRHLPPIPMLQGPCRNQGDPHAWGTRPRFSAVDQ